jgi:formylglycine-generating enzyme required for sulfatase activity
MSESSDPDLILTVTQETVVDGRKALRYVAKARDPKVGLYFTTFDSKPFQADPQDHFRELFNDIEQIPQGREEDWLEGRGIQLCEELLPQALRRSLWSLRGSIRTVQILSDEVWIPWELLRLQDPDDDSSSGAFLVEAFSMTRWLLDLPIVMDLPVRRMALVIPRDSGLPKTWAEGARVKALCGAQRQVDEIPAFYREIKEALSSGHYEGWHFAGHGLAFDESSHRWSISLEGREELHPSDLHGPARRLGRGRPLVFLNACHTGRGTISLTGMGGLASAFLKSGAGAFIGSHWDLDDEQAFCFAEEFYRHLFSGAEIGEAIRKARLKLQEKFSSTNNWLAYTVFAHPLARCSAPAPPPRPGTKKSRSPKPSAVDKLPRSKIEVIEERPETKKPVEPKPGEERVHERDGSILVYIPGGDLTLGAEGIHAWSRPVHRVCLNPFWIGKFLVTNDQYSRFLQENTGVPKPAFWESPHFKQPQQPVVGLTWEEAQAYCRWAGLDLPSEAQWEAAARGVDQRSYPWGKEHPTSLHANFGGMNEGTTPVGSYPAGIGPYGTLDQAGNVWEWCADPWASNAYRQFEDGEKDPIARGDAAFRALRGGSWNNPAEDLHAAYRCCGTAKLRFNDQGFRCLKR